MTFVIRCFDKNKQITFDSTVRTIRKTEFIKTQSNVAGVMDLTPYAGLNFDIHLMPAQNVGLQPVPLVVREGNSLRWSAAPVSCYLILGVSS
jgi:hypothetical protein